MCCGGVVVVLLVLIVRRSVCEQLGVCVLCVWVQEVLGVGVVVRGVPGMGVYGGLKRTVEELRSGAVGLISGP